MNPSTNKLLVLDLDETLVYATQEPLTRPEDFCVGPYFVYRRPHLDAFLSTAFEHFDVAVWTASGEQYAEAVIAQLFEPDTLRFVWSSQRCTVARDWTTGEYRSIKNLSKVKKFGYPLESVIAVDDTPEKYARSYGNLVTVRAFLGDPEDAELCLLRAYLPSLRDVANVRGVEKRYWRLGIEAQVDASARGASELRSPDQPTLP